MTPVARDCPDEETRALFELTTELADEVLRPRVDAAERDGSFPREEFRVLGRAGLLALPYPERFGGGGQPYQTYLQVVEELSRAWLAVGLGVSVHTLTCFPLATAGTAEQQQRWLPELLGGEQLGAYCLSEPASGSDAAAHADDGEADGPDYRHGRGQGLDLARRARPISTRCSPAPRATTRARTGPGGSAACTCPRRRRACRPRPAEHKMGMRASVTAQMIFDGARVPAGHLVGGEGSGLRPGAGRAGCRAARHRRLRHRRGPGGAGRRGRLGA